MGLQQAGEMGWHWSDEGQEEHVQSLTPAME